MAIQKIKDYHVLAEERDCGVKMSYQDELHTTVMEKKKRGNYYDNR
jgi:hypothetical protein